MGLISVWHVLTCAGIANVFFLSWLILEWFRWWISNKEQRKAKWGWGVFGTERCENNQLCRWHRQMILCQLIWCIVLRSERCRPIKSLIYKILRYSLEFYRSGDISCFWGAHPFSRSYLWNHFDQINSDNRGFLASNFHHFTLN